MCATHVATRGRYFALRNCHVRLNLSVGHRRRREKQMWRPNQEPPASGGLCMKSQQSSRLAGATIAADWSLIGQGTDFVDIERPGSVSALFGRTRPTRPIRPRQADQTDTIWPAAANPARRAGTSLPISQAAEGVCPVRRKPDTPWGSRSSLGLDGGLTGSGHGSDGQE